MTLPTRRAGDARGIITDHSTGKAVVLMEDGGDLFGVAPSEQESVHAGVRSKIARKAEESGVLWGAKENIGDSGFIATRDAPRARSRASVLAGYTQLGSTNIPNALVTLGDITRKVREYLDAGMMEEAHDYFERGETLWASLGANNLHQEIKEGARAAYQMGSQTSFDLYSAADWDAFKVGIARDGFQPAAIRGKLNPGTWQNQTGADRVEADIIVETQRDSSAAGRDATRQALWFVGTADTPEERELRFQDAKSTIKAVASWALPEGSPEITSRHQAGMARAVMNMKIQHDAYQGTVVEDVFKTAFDLYAGAQREEGEPGRPDEWIRGAEQLASMILGNTDNPHMVKTVMAGIDNPELTAPTPVLARGIATAATDFANVDRALAGAEGSVADEARNHYRTLIRGNNNIISKNSEKYKAAAAFRDGIANNAYKNTLDAAINTTTGGNDLRISSEVVPRLVKLGKVGEDEVGIAAENIRVLANAGDRDRARAAINFDNSKLSLGALGIGDDATLAAAQPGLAAVNNALALGKQEAPAFDFAKPDSVRAYMASASDSAAGADIDAKAKLSKFDSRFTTAFGRLDLDFGTATSIGLTGLGAIFRSIGRPGITASEAAWQSGDVMGVPLRAIMTPQEVSTMWDSGRAHSVRQLRRAMLRAHAHGIIDIGSDGAPIYNSNIPQPGGGHAPSRSWSAIVESRSQSTAIPVYGGGTHEVKIDPQDKNQVAAARLFAVAAARPSNKTPEMLWEEAQAEVTRLDEAQRKYNDAERWAISKNLGPEDIRGTTDRQAAALHVGLQEAAAMTDPSVAARMDAERTRQLAERELEHKEMLRRGTKVLEQGLAAQADQAKWQREFATAAARDRSRMVRELLTAAKPDQPYAPSQVTAMMQAYDSMTD